MIPNIPNIVPFMIPNIPNKRISSFCFMIPNICSLILFSTNTILWEENMLEILTNTSISLVTYSNINR
jgi:hypothetical protein